MGVTNCVNCIAPAGLDRCICECACYFGSLLQEAWERSSERAERVL